MGFKSHLKCGFESILEKKHFPAGLFFCMSYMKRFSKRRYSQKPPLPRKSPGCTPDDLLTQLFIKSDSQLFIFYY